MTFQYHRTSQYHPRLGSQMPRPDSLSQDCESRTIHKWAQWCPGYLPTINSWNAMGWWSWPHTQVPGTGCECWGCGHLCKDWGSRPFWNSSAFHVSPIGLVPALRHLSFSPSSMKELHSYYPWCSHVEIDSSRVTHPKTQWLSGRSGLWRPTSLLLPSPSIPLSWLDFVEGLDLQSPWLLFFSLIWSLRRFCSRTFGIKTPSGWTAVSPTPPLHHRPSSLTSILLSLFLSLLPPPSSFFSSLLLFLSALPPSLGSFGILESAL